MSIVPNNLAASRWVGTGQSFSGRDLAPPSNAEIKNKWLLTSAPAIFLYKVLIQIYLVFTGIQFMYHRRYFNLAIDNFVTQNTKKEVLI